jgi:hypothetical protein
VQDISIYKDDMRNVEMMEEMFLPRSLGKLIRPRKIIISIP